MNDKNTKLIQPNGMELAQDGKWFHGQGEWCSFDIADLVDRLREVHELKQTGQLGLNEAGLETAKEFTWGNTTSRLEAVLGATHLAYQES